MILIKAVFSFVLATFVFLFASISIEASQANINKIVNQAKQQINSGNNEKALEIIRDGLRAYPRTAELFLEGGKIRAAMGNSAMAISNYELALRYSPGDKEIVRLLAQEYKKMGNKQKASEYERMFFDQTEKADNKKQLENLVEKNYPNLKVLLLTLDSLVKVGQYDPALEIISNNLQKFKRDPGIYFYAGIIRFEKKQYDMAIVNFNNALSDRSLYFRSYYYLGMIYEQLKRKDQALANYRLLLQYPISDNLKEEITAKVDVLSQDQSARARQQLRSMQPTQAYIPLDSIFGIEISDTTTNSGREAFKISQEHVAANRYDELTAQLVKISLDAAEKSLEEDILWANANIFMYLNLSQQAEKNLSLLSSKFGNSKRKLQYEYFHGLTLKMQGKNQEALKKFQSVASTRNSPFAVSALMNQGEIYEINSDNNRAVGIYSNILDMYKKGTVSDDAITPQMLNFKIANALIKDFKTARAKNHLLEIINGQDYKNPYTGKAILLLADSEYRNGNSAEALTYYKLYFNNYTIVDRNDLNNTWVIFQKGNCHRNLNNLEKAVDLYKGLIDNYSAEDNWVKAAKWKLDDTIWQARFKENFKPNQAN